MRRKKVDNNRNSSDTFCSVCGKPKEPAAQYCNECATALQNAYQRGWHLAHNCIKEHRYSGFDDRKIDLDAIKKKYAGGVTREIINEFLGIQD